MTITKEIRQIEQHLTQIADTQLERLAIITEAQGQCAKMGKEYELSILMIAKMRIIRGMSK